jgi:hypothetical protein
MTKRRTRKAFRYEHRSQPMLPRPLFLRRIVFHLVLATALVFLSLAVGILGYRYFAGRGWFLLKPP